MSRFLRMHQLWVVLSLLVFGVAVHPYIPPGIQLTAVFDMNDHPINGNKKVYVHLFYSDNLEVPFYEEILRDVPFDNGVGTFLIGQDGSLYNQYFDRPDIIVSISVLQQNIKFPMSSVPYAIRSKESNKARRVDNDAVVKFLETDRRVGIHTKTPELALDVNGSIIVGMHRPSDELKNGVMMFNSNQNQFMAYRNGWQSMSWMPDPEDASKWTRDGTSIRSDKAVGIGRIPNSSALAVSNNVRIDSKLHVRGDMNVFGGAQLTNGQGVQENGEWVVSSVVLPEGNTWKASGDLTFSGILYGEAGANLMGLNHFAEGVFMPKHLSQNLFKTEHIKNKQIGALNFSLGSVFNTNLVSNQVFGEYIADYAISSIHIKNGEIQPHHIKKNIITSANIRGHVLLQEKFANNSVLSRHVVDGQITGDKLKSKHILRDHLKFEPFIRSSHIMNGTILGKHVPLNSLPVVDFNGVVPIRHGGIGQQSLPANGVLFSSPTAQYQSAPTFFSFLDGNMGIGTPALSKTLLTISNDSHTRLGIISDAETASLVLKRPTSAWWFKLTDSGDFSLLKNDSPILAVSKYNRVGVGLSHPTERLTLSGPMVIGDTLVETCVPGSIKYSGGQYSFCFGNQQWVAASPSAASYRSMLNQHWPNMLESSLVFSKNSTISGYELWVDSITDSLVSGQLIRALLMANSDVVGVRSDVFGITGTSASLDFSEMAIVNDSRIYASHSALRVADHLDATINASIGSLINHSRMQSSMANVFGVNQSVMDIKNSALVFASDANIQAVQSRLSMLNEVSIQSTMSHVFGVHSSDLAIHHSSIIGGHGLQVNASNSAVYFSDNSVINGHSQVVFSGNHHQLMSNEHLALSGGHHTGYGNRVVAIGSNIQSNHHDSVLINASNQPLVSDRNGQLKIQADGGIHIQFTPEVGLAMGGDMVGWANISDANLKTIKDPISFGDILKKVNELPVQFWNYKAQKNRLHIGPTAQDFYAIFQFGNSDKVIHSIDSDGVLLASVKGLNEVMDQVSTGLMNQQNELVKSNEEIHAMMTKINHYKQRIRQLEANFIVNLRLLKQFNSDHAEQDRMIQYIEGVIRLNWWRYVCEQLLQPIGILSLVIGGAAFGSLFGHFARKRL